MKMKEDLAMRVAHKHLCAMLESTPSQIDFNHLLVLEEKSASYEIVEELGVATENIQIMKQSINRA